MPGLFQSKIKAIETKKEIDTLYFIALRISLRESIELTKREKRKSS